MTLFRLFHGSPEQVEGDLNVWAEALSPGAKVRRTQLAAAPAFPGASPVVYALVSYEPPEPSG